MSFLIDSSVIMNGLWDGRLFYDASTVLMMMMMMMIKNVLWITDRLISAMVYVSSVAS